MTLLYYSAHGDHPLNMVSVSWDSTAKRIALLKDPKKIEAFTKTYNVMHECYFTQ